MPATWCATPNALCWSCASPLPPRQHRLRHRSRLKYAGTVAAEEAPGLPEKERQERRDECGAAKRLDLQRGHDQRGKGKGRADEHDETEPIDDDRRSGLKQRLPGRRAGAPAQLRRGSAMASAEPLLLEHALP